MRTIRGLQITSIVVLSPVLLLLISLICMLCISIFKQIVSTPADILIQQQQQRSFNNKQAKRFRFFTKMRQSPIAWCAVIILYALYVLLKVKKIFFCLCTPWIENFFLFFLLLWGLFFLFKRSTN